jgi:hypothetical protein
LLITEPSGNENLDTLILNYAFEIRARLDGHHYAYIQRSFGK